ncbi:hypothetical protein TVAG_481410 [Trichomonas vaginalis G3]|uniref:Uncharacterized protein n=1 Tax=Trichomonas vaginalis (strain ATCC PRA-98 / G3) TaxID=412133 RepID=A2F216_TRIV3|nr:hypothetical protein TVAGG3_0477220 [Trichomonas vaginalis G3]EAY01071.1 hypothetical protein TVAG_481410 [Trichomonas vaginalis G3]KAI5515492.1 hypothetical protein TVAGG3_0477220 [Trichomonas vaginalis G3]|eukprot:XP_001330092.1 hypothetical protein [Trichomonas vaginalis G3]
MKTIYPSLESIRLESKATCTIENKEESIDIYLIGPFLFGLGIKPSNFQLIFYSPHFCSTLDRQKLTITFIPNSPFFHSKILLALPSTEIAIQWHKFFIKINDIIHKIPQNKIPPVSILAKVYNKTTNSINTADVNVFGEQIRIKEQNQKPVKFEIQTQNINCVLALEMPTPPKDYYFTSFAVVYRKFGDLYVICDSIDQLMFTFISIDLTIWNIRKQKTEIKLKMAQPFSKKNNLQNDLPQFICDMNINNTLELPKTPELTFVSRVPIPEKASNSVEIIDFNREVHRTIILQPFKIKSNFQENQNNEIPIEDIPKNAFREEIEKIRNSIEISNNVEVKVPQEKVTKEFMQQSASELSSCMYFRPICDPRLIFLCQKIGIPFNNPVFSLNGQKELDQIASFKTLSELSVFISSILINGTTDTMLLSKIPLLCANDKNILESLPNLKMSPFSKLTIFVSRLIKTLRMKKFVELLMNNHQLRKTIYREDAMCNSPIFLEKLKERVTVYFSKASTPCFDVYPLPFATRERYEYLIRSIVPKAEKDPELAGRLIFYLVKFFTLNLKNGKILQIVDLTMKIIKDENQRQMLNASYQFAIKNKESDLGKFAMTLLKGLECGQLYVWVLYIGKAIMSNKSMYNEEAPALDPENIVIISDSIIKLAGVIFDFDIDILDKFPLFH